MLVDWILVEMEICTAVLVVVVVVKVMLLVIDHTIFLVILCRNVAMMAQVHMALVCPRWIVLNEALQNILWKGQDFFF